MSARTNTLRRTAKRDSTLKDLKLRLTFIEDSQSKIKGQAFINHWTTKAFFIILTIWSLFAEELKILLTTKEADIGFSISIIVVQIFFLTEIILSCIYFDDYVNGFYFWIDIFSIITMFLDIHWFYDMLLEQSFFSSSSSNVELLNKRNTKISSRAVRVMRIVRLIRIIRISKFYKFSVDFQRNKLPSSMFASNEDFTDRLKIAKTFADYTIRKVIILVIAMIVAVIVFDPNFYYRSISSIEFGMKNFKNYNSLDDPSLKIAFDAYILSHQTNSLRIDEKVELEDDCKNLFDPINKSVYSDNNTSKNLFGCYAVFNNRIEAKLSALLNIIKTFIIILILFLGYYCFNKETESMVIKPVNSMIKKIKKYSNNPAKAKREEKHEDKKQSLKDSEGKLTCCDEDNDHKMNKKVETVILEKTIGKIGSLLALGYGETASNIIEKNMKDNKGIINPLASGTNIIGIFCLVKLLYQNEIIEILGENCSVLINEICKLTSDVLTEEEGAYMHKNTGDGLLIIWKIDSNFMKKNEKGHIIIQNCAEVQSIVDKSIISVIHMLIRLGKSAKLRKLQDKLYEIGSNYCIMDNVSFTINMGWAIEGATGSNFKIDISYYSPTIRLAKQLENLNKYYQRNLIIFSDVFDHMTKDAKNYFRMIDSLKFGDKISKTIFTIDMDLYDLPVEKEKRNKRKESLNNIQITKLNIGKSALLNYSNDNKNPWLNFLTTDKDFGFVRKRFTNEFMDTYKQGFEYFTKGKWDLAKKLFEMSNYILDENEYITMDILSFMSKTKFIAPENWNGIRNIESIYE